MSLAVSTRFVAVSSSVVTLWLFATGASLTDWIVTFTVIVSVPPLPSET